MCQGSAIARDPLSAAVRRAERARLRKVLRAEGYAVTAQRRATYDALLDANDHTCVEHILEAIQRAHPTWRVNKTTVYRNLDLFQALGLVREMRHEDGRAQYELALHGPHGHLICRQCGALFDLDPALAATVQHRLREHSGFAVDLAGHALYGVCARCATVRQGAVA
ncbi:MAG TPA: transcriptional repressor [Chloroflexi bacterium]|jgi:Fur family ferric uptake transcriptional regulator|nr:transcriptional repressor [Chloroflexota bacterium]